MKKLFCCLIGVNCFFITFSQTQYAIRGGYNLSTAKVKDFRIEQPTGYKSGFNLGIQAKIPFEPPIYFSPFISYSLRGYSINPLIDSLPEIETSIHYIDIAPLLSYDIKTGSGNHFTITAGPLAGIAFSGTEKSTANGHTTSSKMTFSLSGNYSYIDMAMYGSLGYHFNKIFIEAAYQHGFVSINNEQERDGRKIENRLFSFNIGYYFK